MMGAIAMPSEEWRELMLKKGMTPPDPVLVYQIVLNVRGRTVIKEYACKRDFERWKANYEYQQTLYGSGIESIEVNKVYR